MKLDIRKEKGVKGAAEFVAGSILAQLAKGKKVLWLVAGGSSIPVAVAASKIIRKHPHKKLCVTLTDERYGEVGHSDSNWAKLLARDFKLPQANLKPVLKGRNMEIAVSAFRTELEKLYKWADWKIGIFGVGMDGHTAGILPESDAVSVPRLAFGYYTEKFNRITMTAKAIGMLDQAVVFSKGEKKRKAINQLSKNLPVSKMPAQALKQIPLLTIFLNFKK